MSSGVNPVAIKLVPITCPVEKPVIKRQALQVLNAQKVRIEETVRAVRFDCVVLESVIVPMVYKIYPATKARLRIDKVPKDNGDQVVCAPVIKPAALTTEQILFLYPNKLNSSMRRSKSAPSILEAPKSPRKSDV